MTIPAPGSSLCAPERAGAASPASAQLDRIDSNAGKGGAFTHLRNQFPKTAWQYWAYNALILRRKKLETWALSSMQYAMRLKGSQ